MFTFLGLLPALAHFRRVGLFLDWIAHLLRRVLPINFESRSEPDYELDITDCAGGYERFIELITNPENAKLLFLAVDVTPKTANGRGISQFGTSTWIPHENSMPGSLQWQIQGSRNQSLNPKAMIDQTHVYDKYKINESQLSELLLGQWSHYTSKGYITVIVGHGLKEVLLSLGREFYRPLKRALFLDTKKIWNHLYESDEEISLDACVERLDLSCKHLQQQSAGNNAFHVIQILEKVWENQDAENDRISS